MHLQTLTTTLALAGVGMSLPTTSGNNQESAAAPLPLSKRSAADTILMIMPTSGSCSGRGDECVTADVAAPYLVSGMTHYSVSTAMEQAGILSLVAYESNEMQYKKNLNNAASGQGTSNEQSGTFNLEFANTFAELKALGLTTSNVLDYVTNNTYNFWTGPWYYSSQSTCSTARSMATSGSTAWEWFQEYMANCDGVNLATANEPGRITYWNNALAAFGLTNDSTTAT